MESTDHGAARKLCLAALVVLYALVIVKALSYWVYAYHKDPSAPLSVTAIYRQPDDVEYYEQIQAMSRGNFGESNIAEKHGSGVASFPYASFVLHAICYRLFGAVGFIVADVIVYLVFFRLLAALLGLLGGGQLVSHAAAAMIVTDGFSRLMGMLSGYEILGSRFVFEVWGTRIPRPFITEVFFLACLFFAVSLLTGHSAPTKRRSWINIGVALSLLIQGDVYLAVTAGASIGLLAAYLLLESPKRADLIKCLLWFAVSALVAVLPFLLQRLLEHPDLPRRLGVFSLPRSAAFRIGFMSVTPVLIALTMGLFFAFLQPVFYCIEQARKNARAIFFLSLIPLVAFLGLHINVFVLGKTVQVDHFPYAFESVSAYSLSLLCYVLFLVFFELVRRRLQAFPTLPSLLGNHLDQPVTLMVCALVAFHLATSRPHYPMGHLRGDLEPYQKLGPNYRSAFTDLAKELSKDTYKSASVVATFDTKVRTWWSTFREGNSFNPDVFLTTVSDAEIESRLVILCKLLGMQQPEQFGAFVKEWMINAIWLGHNKYQATRLYTFGPIEQYPKEVRKSIQNLSWFETWHLFIPHDEVTRLQDLFARTRLEPSGIRPDVIVLTSYDLAQGLEPLPVFFAPSFQNDTFKVWTRRR